MVRTLAEVHADRVTVTVTFDDAMSERLYTAAEVGDAQAGEAELVAKPLQRRIAELESELVRRTIERDQREAARATLERQVHLYDVDRKTEQQRADKNQTWAESAEKVAAKLRTELEESRALVAQRDKALDQATDDLAALVSQRRDRDRLLEISKKNEATALAQVAVAGHRTESAETALHEAQHEIQKLSRTIGRVAGVVMGNDIRIILDGGETNPERLASSVRKVRDIVGAPFPYGPPTPPVQSETQA
jgi:chromosome segregation ATPase